MIKDLKKIFNKRQQQLIALLQNDDGAIELSKQHQIYGAINELNLVVKTLDYHYIKMQQDDIRPEDMIRETQEQLNKEFNEDIQSMRQQAFERKEDEDISFKEQFRG